MREDRIHMLLTSVDWCSGFMQYQHATDRQAEVGHTA